ATALPRIASDFDSFSLQGWIATSFILTHCLPLILRPTSPHISCQVVFISTIVIFELGSLVCGVVQNVGQLIAGRTASGVGASGI
ncbi:hypothetical protein BDP27DRAFT_1201403, partial [Rhodocollybia butyracea]